MIKLLRKIYYKIFIALLSLRRLLFSYSLGEWVYVKGSKKIFTLTQGVDKPYWKMSRGKLILRLHEREFTKCWKFENMYLTYRSIYRFYMNNWFDIWVNSGIEDWCKKCNIW